MGAASISASEACSTPCGDTFACGGASARRMGRVTSSSSSGATQTNVNSTGPTVIRSPSRSCFSPPSGCPFSCVPFALPTSSAK
ncbi:hypothetical protein [Corallococcus carmarthensis]|uniref:hypothetical protein n=1 Tax=Corallococcus carmarthensis TaxID=2316728 RepID=UPI0020A3819A|nr:hypothetical protein [Corallococcus carmarthensis]